jgi:Dolichyl-phosphate-mannose-protein mannosyltransferase
MKRSRFIEVLDGTTNPQAIAVRPSATAARKAQHGWAINALFMASQFRIYVLLICCSLGFVSILLGPDNSWDLRFYHLYAPWAYLHGRYLYDVGPAQYQGFFNPTADFLFYGLTSSILNESPRIIAFIMGVVHGINAVLVLAIAFQVLCPIGLWERVTLRTVAWLIGVSGAGFVSLLGTTTNDLINSIFALGALLAILKVSEPAAEREVFRGFAVAGVLAGIAVGLKYTAFIFIPGLTLIAIVAGVRRKTAAGPIAFGFTAMLGFLATAGHHLLMLWRDFGNPVFPLFNQIFQSPYYEAVSLRDSQFLPRNFWQLVAYPFFWAKTNSYLVSELTFRDWRGAVAYVAIAAGMLALVARCISRDGHYWDRRFAQTRGLDLVFTFVIVSYFVWVLSFSNYRYAITLEMLTGIVAIGAVIWLFEDGRLRIALAIMLLTAVATTTVYLDWGRGEHPSAGIGSAQYGDRYIDVHVPRLPVNSVVLMATGAPVSYFIPFAEPTAQFLGIENNYLEMTQNNKLASEVKRLMRTPGRPKFVLSIGDFNHSKLNRLLQPLGLRPSTLPCEPIRSNLEEEALSLCPVASD